jgi:DNA polymerase (family 10)
LPIHNSDIASQFNQTADLLAIQGANEFRVRAYRNAARVIDNWPKQLREILQQGETIPKLPGVGADLSSKVIELITTGKLTVFEELKQTTPEGLLELIQLPGLGPKRARLLQEKLNVRSLDDLKKAVQGGQIQNLPGFGSKIESQILEGLARKNQLPKRTLIAKAGEIARALVAELKRAKEVKQITVAGSFRRRLATVGDLDLLASCGLHSDIMERFVSYEDVVKVLSHGTTRSSVILRSGMQVDLRVVPEASFGAALHYFTGSKAHNIAIRTLGLKYGLKINEYGVFRGSQKVGGKREEDVFKSVKLPYIEPELRENRGEIEAAREGALPKLVSLDAIRGDLHAHTQETDGRLTLEAMADAARQRGYSYLAITDHSRHLTVAHGMTPARLKKQIREIDRINAQSQGLILLKAIEVDILEDGSLDLPNSVLSLLDLTVCSIHSKFNLSEKKQTERIIRAMDNPYFHIFGHPTGQLLGQREPYLVNLEKVMMAAKERGCFLEVNAQPERMDLSDVYCGMAKEIGVKVAISTDAHSDHDLEYMEFGVAQARRGWLEADEVLNTRSWAQLKKLLKRK